MPHTFTATTVAADAPDIEAGIYDARYDGIAVVTGFEGGQYSKPSDDGRRHEWTFTIFEDGEVLYDEGDPIVLTGLSSMSTNTQSKTVPRTVRYLKALMTPAQFATFEAGEGANLDEGAMCQVEVAINDRGWPNIANVLPVPKRHRSRTTAAASDEE